MVRKLPSLNALKAFEAAARHQSLVKAADELNVTHAAISRQVRELESTLRITLFERTGRGVLLTEAGASLARELTRGLDIIAAATGRFAKTSRTRQQLSITSDVPFAMMWLVARLGDFASQHPDADLVLDPTHRLVDFAKEGIDLGVRYGAGSWRGVEAAKLTDVELIVVCAPSLIARERVSSPADLPPARLIQEQDRSHWRLWLDAAGVGDKITPRGPTLLADLAMSAAEAGHGYALADRLIASDALKAGRLVSPFSIVVPHNAYFVVWPEGKKLSRLALDFRHWLIEKVGATLRESSAPAGASTPPRKRPSLKKTR